MSLNMQLMLLLYYHSEKIACSDFVVKVTLVLVIHPSINFQNKRMFIDWPALWSHTDAEGSHCFCHGHVQSSPLNNF